MTTPTNDSEHELEAILAKLYESDLNVNWREAKTAINRLLIKRALEELEDTLSFVAEGTGTFDYIQTRIATLQKQLEQIT